MLHHTVGDAHLGRMEDQAAPVGLCWQNPSLGTPDCLFSFLQLEHTCGVTGGQDHSGITSRASQFKCEAVLYLLVPPSWGTPWGWGKG